MQKRNAILPQFGISVARDLDLFCGRASRT
jgi:hypothetical protein